MTEFKTSILILSIILTIYLLVHFFINLRLGFKYNSKEFAKMKCKKMPSKRKFMENLVNKRFNFLMLIFGIIIASALQIKQ